MRTRHILLGAALALTSISLGTVALTATAAAGTFRPLDAPARLADTRPDGNTVDGAAARSGVVQAGTALELQIGGRAGVAGNAAAATLNVTAVGATAPGFLTVYPCDQARPGTSNVNYFAGTVHSNGVFTGLDGGGKACVFALTDVHVIVDVNGWMPDAVFDPLPAPARIADTRPAPDGATVDGGHVGQGVLGGQSRLRVPVAGRAGIAADARSVVLNVTVTNPVADGFVTVFPCTEQVPTASNVNYSAGEITANAVVAGLDAEGHVCVYTHAAAHVIVDVSGSLDDGAFVGLATPQRLVDSRPGEATVDGDAQGFGYRRAGTTLQFPITGRASIPDNVVAVALNVTAVNAAEPGFLTLYPRNAERPNASNVNYAPNDVVANTVIAAVGGGGMACLFALSNVDVIVDIAGYFVGSAPVDSGVRCPAELPPNAGFDGAHPVGEYQLPPGRYAATVSGTQLCDIHRSDTENWLLGTLYGSLGKWGPGQFIVDVRPTDGYVRYTFESCPTLTTYQPPATHRTTISPGWYTVGESGHADLRPGRYQATFTTQWDIGNLESYRCVGRTVRAFDGNRNPSATIQQVEVAKQDAGVTVQIDLRAGEGFFTEGCTPWIRLGG